MVGAGVASPNRKSNKRPMVDSSHMDGGVETVKGGKEVRKVRVGASAGAEDGG
jgi:hypothetical protein